MRRQRSRKGGKGFRVKLLAQLADGDNPDSFLSAIYDRLHAIRMIIQLSNTDTDKVRGGGK